MLQNYLKLALRSLRKNRVYALLNIFGLGLSMACSILIFMLIRRQLSFDTFHEKAARTLMVVTEGRTDKVEHLNAVPYPMAGALRQEYSFLEKTAMVVGRRETLIKVGEPGAAPAKFKEAKVRAVVQPEFFDIFDFPLVKGDLAGLQEPNTALLTEKYARKYFGTTDAVGKTFNVNSAADFKVVGVLRDIPENTDYRYQIYCSWATLSSDPDAKADIESWGGINGSSQCFALLREGHSVEELETQLPAFGQKYKHPSVNSFFYHSLPLSALHFDPDYGVGMAQRNLWALGLIAIFLLVTACVNFVNMATAQALNRSREVGVRKSLGSTRPQLFWQFMSETSLIVVLAAGMGLLLANVALPVMNQLTGTVFTINLARDSSLYGFLAALMVAVVFLAGAYPGIVQSGFRPVQSLKGPLDSNQAGGFSLRRVLVTTQFVVSQVLIIGAVVITEQMDYAKKADLGFNKDAIVTTPIYTNENAKLSTFRQQLSAIAGVEQVSFCMQPPASEANWNTGLRFDNHTEDENWGVNAKFVDSHYAEVFGLRLVAGRNMVASDTVNEIVVNETVVKKLNFADPSEVIGKKLNVDGRIAPIVGVVKDFHNLSFREAIDPLVMMSSTKNYDVCALKINLQNPAPTLAAIEKIWTETFPDQYYEHEFMAERVEAFYTAESNILQLIRLFAGIAVFIGCLGLYGLTTFLVARKTKEIGIRKTLGASVSGILWLFGKEYMRLIIIAFAVAAPLAWWAMNAWLQDYVYRITIGTGIFLFSLAATFLVALLTVGFQSVRAALRNPVKALRSE